MAVVKSSDPGREPIQLVEIRTPKCRLEHGTLPCRATLNGYDTESSLSVNFAKSGLDSEYTTLDATLSLEADGVLFTNTVSDRSELYIPGTASVPFSGDVYQYVYVRGRWVSGAMSQLNMLFYTSAGYAGTSGDQATGTLYDLDFNTISAGSVTSGDEFILVFDAADSSKYATNWQGNSIDGLQFYLGDYYVAHQYVVYEIQVSAVDPSATRLTRAPCFLTRASCQDAPSFALGAQQSLFFSQGRDVEFISDQVPYAIPSLVNVSTAPTRVNIGGANPDAQGLGNRALCNIEFMDHQHSDRVVDPYLDQRSYDPMSPAKGSFWTRWKARNPYRQNILLTVYEGYVGQQVGWEYELYKATFSTGSGDQTGDIDSGVLIDSGITSDFNVNRGDTEYGVIITGTIEAEETGTYTFELHSDDGSILEIMDGGTAQTFTQSGISPAQDYLDNDGLHALAAVEGTVSLTAGIVYTVRIKYFNGSSYGAIQAFITGPDGIRHNLRNYQRMYSRSYFMNSIEGPDASGRVTISGKDILAKIEERKAQMPEPSPGKLYAAINSSVTTFVAANAVVSDYAASGYLRIDDEIMPYTGRAAHANGVSFTGVTRGQYNTVAADHDVNAVVQQCAQYTSQNLDDMYEIILRDFGGIDSSYFDRIAWETEYTNFLSAYIVNVLISEPTSVFQVMSELQTASLSYVWWDERDMLIKMKALRGFDITPKTLTEQNHIIAGSFKFKELPRNRVSRVYVHWNMHDYTAGYDDAEAYTSRYVIANLGLEGDDQYGEKSIRNVFARWLFTEALAANTASKIITGYAEMPLECQFDVDAKDNDLWIGDEIFISHHLLKDIFGDNDVRQWTINSAQMIVPGEKLRFTAVDTTPFGGTSYIMASGAADYTGTAADPDKNCYIGNSSGLLSDGEPGGKIS